jgi:enoyl-CoA hydratase
MRRPRFRIDVDSTGIAVLVVDRAERLNAFDSSMVVEMSSALTRLNDDEAVRVVILTGAGEKAFISGGDVAEMRDLEFADADRFVYAGQELTRQIERMGKAIIAAVNGYALGGGTEIALACDIRIASDRAVFGLPEVTLGLLPGWGGTQRAVRLLGRGLALELILTGRRVTADEALRMGLVNRVVPAADLMSAAREIAALISSNSPVAVRQAKKAILRGSDASLEQGLTIEAEAWLYLIAHPDRREGLSALLEKRPPRWQRRPS